MWESRPIRLILVDDHDVVRSGIRALLDAQGDMEVVGEAASGVEAMEVVKELQPDVVLMDISLPDMDGMEVTRRVKQCCQTTAVLALTIHEGREYFFEMLNAGASGYVPKSAAPEELMLAIRAVARGEVYLHSSVAQLLLQDYLRREEDEQAEETTSAGLTEREREVLTLLAEGLMNREIGERLNISPKTVARHRENIMRKLKLHSRTELVKYAIKIGLIDIGEE
ncbi:MAG TPA: response regulator transcription factor [Chloroflexi bacterium]|nr:response regulator transcription factor [Chloroflexota bacterium]